MGDELIPFKKENEAKKFMTDHFGKKVLSFEEIKEDLLKQSLITMRFYRIVNK